LQQTIYSSGEKACSPARCNTAVGAELLGDVLVRHPLGGQQQDASAHLYPCFDPLALGKNTQAPIIVGTQLDWLGNSHGNDLPRTGRSALHISSVIYDALH